MMRSDSSESGICASTVSQPFQPDRASKPMSWPRRALTTALTFAVASLGTWMRTCMIDSSRTGEQFGMPSVIAMRAAVWNAASEESTA